MSHRVAPVHSEFYEIDLFGAKVCCGCGEEFAANTDYFVQDAQCRDGLTYDCRNCRNECSRESATRNRERRTARQREYRTRRKAATS